MAEHFGTKIEKLLELNRRDWKENEKWDDENFKALSENLNAFTTYYIQQQRAQDFNKEEIKEVQQRLQYLVIAWLMDKKDFTSWKYIVPYDQALKKWKNFPLTAHFKLIQGFLCHVIDIKMRDKEWVEKDKKVPGGLISQYKTGVKTIPIDEDTLQLEDKKMSVLDRIEEKEIQAELNKFMNDKNLSREAVGRADLKMQFVSRITEPKIWTYIRSLEPDNPLLKILYVLQPEDFEFICRENKGIYPFPSQKEIERANNAERIFKYISGLEKIGYKHKTTAGELKHNQTEEEEKFWNWKFIKDNLKLKIDERTIQKLYKEYQKIQNKEYPVMAIDSDTGKEFPSPFGISWREKIMEACSNSEKRLIVYRKLKKAKN